MNEWQSSIADLCAGLRKIEKELLADASVGHTFGSDLVRGEAAGIARSIVAIQKSEQPNSAAWKWYRGKYAKEKEALTAKEDAYRSTIQRAIEIIECILDCKNNDCTCRKGYGPCNMCREAAMEWLKGIDMDKSMKRTTGGC